MKTARTSRAPLAVTSDGTMFINAITLTTDDSLDAVIQVARAQGDQIFVGVVLGRGDVRQALRMLDDACAEVAARVGGGRP